MGCAACGVVNDAGRKFCKECGARLSLTCSACGAMNAPDDKFCGECGSALAATQPAAASAGSQPAKDGGTERRVVSVLFVDLVGFTTLAEGRDAEDVRSMLTQYFDAASDAVQRHGGTVEKFIGDAVMAVWGHRLRTRTTPSEPCVRHSRSSTGSRRSAARSGST